ncbi:MAG: hypothetical protein IKQ41_12985 [Clostridia bacterium]|nr:hypothetical protein [Clostridia bacterium]
MNLLIAAVILITSFCLLLVSYRTHARQVDQMYLEEARRAAKNVAALISPEIVDWFRKGNRHGRFPGGPGTRRGRERSGRDRRLAEKQARFLQ